MNDIKINCVASGSKGNFYTIEASGDLLLIEAGISIKKIQEAVNFDFSNVIGCLLSHTHTDHSKSAKELTKRGINVYSHAETFNFLGIKSHRAKAVEPFKQFKVGSFDVIGMPTMHDDLFPLAYVIKHGNNKILFLTDSYYFKYKIPGLTHIMIEASFDETILKNRLKDGKISEIMYNRLISSHFSYQNMVKMLKANDLSKVEEIYLLHLSDANSDAEAFRDGVEKTFGIQTTVC